MEKLQELVWAQPEVRQTEKLEQRTDFVSHAAGQTGLIATGLLQVSGKGLTNLSGIAGPVFDPSSAVGWCLKVQKPRFDLLTDQMQNLLKIPVRIKEKNAQTFSTFQMDNLFILPIKQGFPKSPKSLGSVYF